MIKAIFIDIDNTLLSFDEHVKSSMKEGFERFGYPEYSPDMYSVFKGINDVLWRELEQNIITLEELKAKRWDLIFTALNIEGNGAEFEEYFRERLFYSAHPEPFAIEILEYLYGKYPLFVASNGPLLQQKNRLKVGKMNGYFKDFFVSDDIGYSKPGREFFDEAFRRIRQSGYGNIAPEETMIIGDSLSADMQGGFDYGMATCFYNKYGKDDVPEFLNYNIISLKEIREIL